MKKRTFHYVKDNSAKFWAITLNRNTHIVQFGRIGSNGQEKTKEFASPAVATQAYEKLINEKLRAGYLEIKDSVQRIAPVEVVVQPVSLPTPVVAARPAISEDLTFTGHTGTVSCVAFAPDYSYIVSGDDDGNVRLWDLATRKLIYKFSHPAGIQDIAISPDCQTIACSFGYGSLDRYIYLWNARNGRELHQFGHNDESPDGLVFSPDGRLLLNGSFEGAVRLWDVASGQELRQFKGLRSPIDRVAFSPDGRLVCAAGQSILIWNVAGGRAIVRIKGDREKVCGLSFSPDSKQLLWCDRDGHVHVIDAEQGNELRKIQSPEFEPGQWYGACSMVFSCDGRYSFGSYDCEYLRLWELATGKVIYQGHEHNFDCNVTLAPDLTTAVIGRDKRVCLLKLSY